MTGHSSDFQYACCVIKVVQSGPDIDVVYADMREKLHSSRA